MNARDIQHYAKETTDTEGNPVVQIPLHIWQQFTTEKPISPIKQINSLLHEWEQHPDEDMPDEWWDEFTVFLQENRLIIINA